MKKGKVVAVGADATADAPTSHSHTYTHPYKKNSPLIFGMYLAGIVAGGLYSVPPFYFKRFPLVAALTIAFVRGFSLNFGVYYAVRFPFPVRACACCFAFQFAVAPMAAVRISSTHSRNSG